MISSISILPRSHRSHLPPLLHQPWILLTQVTLVLQISIPRERKKSVKRLSGGERINLHRQFPPPKLVQTPGKCERCSPMDPRECDVPPWSKKSTLPMPHQGTILSPALSAIIRCTLRANSSGVSPSRLTFVISARGHEIGGTKGKDKVS